METHKLDAMEKCWGPNCVTIGYSIIGKNAGANKYIDGIMRDVAADNDLVF